MSACLIARLAQDSSIHLHLARVCDLISQVITHTMQGVEQEAVMTPRHDLLSSNRSDRSPHPLSAEQHGGGGNVTARSSRGTKPPRDYSKLQLGPYRVEAGSNEPFTLEPDGEPHSDHHLSTDYDTAMQLLCCCCDVFCVDAMIFCPAPMFCFGLGNVADLCLRRSGSG